MSLNRADHARLRGAVGRLENPGFAMQIVNLVGMPIELGVDRLPTAIRTRINTISEKALRSALTTAVRSMKGGQGTRSRDVFHRIAASASGAAGGAFGLAALTVELPLSTVIMLRSIADIARSEGEDVRVADAQVACLEVFALGGRSDADDSAESAYYAVRVALAREVSLAAKHLAAKGLSGKGGPAIARLIARIAARFSIPVTEKVAAQSVPVVGAIGGAAVNLLFVNHFQEMARGHFTVRHLERKYGETEVREAYERIRRGA
jgi:hypothetical protein